MPSAPCIGARHSHAPHLRDDETPHRITRHWCESRSSGSLYSRNHLVIHYMTTHVRPIAANIHAMLPAQVELDDLIQQGYLGLVDAMDRFDIERHTRFETFSRRRISGAIHDYLRSIDPVPRLTRSRSKLISSTRERFTKRHGRPPNDEELRGLLDVEEPTYRRMLADQEPAMTVPFSNVHPDTEMHSGADADAMDAFEDPRHPGPDLRVQKRDLKCWLIRGFSHRDRLIVILYYYEQMTMQEIGRALGISESRVSQRLQTILACLRSRLAATGAEQEFLFAE